MSYYDYYDASDYYYDSYDSYPSPSAWLDADTLSSLGWRAHTAASFALTIIMILALIGILGWTLKSRVRTTATKATLTWFITAICFTIVTLVVRFIQYLVVASLGSVSQSYAVVIVIFNTFQYLADALLLAAIFAYMIPRSAFARPSTTSTPPKAPTRLHLSLCGLLIVLWLVITALRLAAVLRLLRDSYGEDFFRLYLSSQWLEIAFDIFYLLAACEIFCLAMMAVTSSRNPKDNTSRNDQQQLLFLVLVGIPLLIRQAWEFALGLASIFNSGIKVYPELIRAGLARQIFYVLCTTIIYAGLLLLMKNLSRKKFSNRNAYGDPKNSGNGLELGNLGPDVPIMRVAAPTEDQAPFTSHAPKYEPTWNRAAEYHPQDVMYNGP
ncbi:MAG: hypothetical protein L6R36_005799 [Xanthoria steineri]|nr:MAG: hypothetical protein L6R36_005799 [Xanthoria steineri]